MISMVNFTRAIKRPFTDLTKLIIGAVLSIIPIVNFLTLGYQLKCAKSAMNGDYKLPEWTEWGDLFMKGLKAVVIGIVYMVPVGAIMLVVLGTLVSGMVGMPMQGGGAGFEGLTAGAGIGGIIILILVLSMAYILPSVMMTFVANDFKLGTAFRVFEIIKKTLNKDYLVTWIVVGIYTVALSAVLIFIPFIGPMLASFATGVTSMTAFGELYPKLKA